MRTSGADQVIDYTQEDYTKSGQRYDLILDVVAYRSFFYTQHYDVLLCLGTLGSLTVSIH